MPSQYLHIVSFDVPFPPNYGGVIDVFYKIRALSSRGVKIHLHCFEYGRERAAELEPFCEKVYYYKRNLSKRFLLSRLPFIVVTRRSELLMERLLADRYPILFEGLHSCYHLADPRLKDRAVLVRNHNIEHEYYFSLASVEKNFFRRAYFRREAAKLKTFEKILRSARHILAISKPDEQVLKGRYANVECISAFHPYEQVEIRQGLGDFALYHGNLEVGENNEAALFLVEQVFAGLSVPLVLAGKKPSAELRAAAARYPNIRLCADIPTSEIDELIRQAQINILPTFQATGIKLKLLAALYSGRHCVVNTPMVVNTGLEELCRIQDEPLAMQKEVLGLMNIPFDETDREKRRRVLIPAFSNSEGVSRLLDLI